MRDKFVEEYIEFVKAMGVMSNVLYGLYNSKVPLDLPLNESIQQKQFRQIYESAEYVKNKTLLLKSSDFVEKRLDGLKKIIIDSECGVIRIDLANDSTKTLNIHTQTVESINDTYNSSFNTVLFTKIERLFIKHSIEEYKLKLETIYKILFELKKTQNELELPAKFGTARKSNAEATLE